MARDDHHVVFDGPVTAKNVLKYDLGGSTAVAVVTVEHVEPVWADDQTWIETRVYGRVDDLITSTDAFFPLGERMTMQWEGGEINVGRILVKAGTVPLIAAGRQYLAFVVAAPESGTFMLVRPPLLIEKGKLVKTLPKLKNGDRVFDDPLHGLRLSKVVGDIRKLAAQASKED